MVVVGVVENVEQRRARLVSSCRVRPVCDCEGTQTKTFHLLERLSFLALALAFTDPPPPPFLSLFLFLYYIIIVLDHHPPPLSNKLVFLITIDIYINICTDNSESIQGKQK